MVPTSVSKLRRQAADEEASGHLILAKQSLQEALGQSGYDPDLFEQYGRLLLALEELVEAGQWLFLSSRREPEYEQAIGIYLGRKGRRGGRRLYASFPLQAKLGGPQNYPQPLCNELKVLGVPDDVAPAVVQQPSRLSRVLMGIGCGGCALYFSVSAVVGAVVVGRWIAVRVGELFR